MHKFRKKPIEIEAFQMTKAHRWDNSEWPHWLNMAWNMEPNEVGCLFCVDGSEQLYINTLEGRQEVTLGDFIIQGVAGEIYPCKPEIFNLTYDTV